MFYYASLFLSHLYSFIVVASVSTSSVFDSTIFHTIHHIRLGAKMYHVNKMLNFVC
jgi:hypothetical protein